MAAEMNNRFELIAAYLSGELPATEVRELEDWRKEKPEHDLFFREAEMIWKHSGSARAYPGNAADDWNELKETLNKRTEVHLWNHNWFRVAAAFIILAVAGVWLFTDRAVDNSKLADNTRYTSGSEVMMVVLPDSTTVWLNQNSSLEIASDFGNGSRKTVLDGEAYFAVRRNTAAPFTVVTDNATTQVLGTSFNVAETANGTRVMVAEGEVAVSAGDANGETVTLHKNEGLELQGKKPETFTVDGAQIGSWRKLNNPALEREKQQPALFIVPEYKWNKNVINQSVIKGRIKNNATVADYRNIELKISYQKANGKRMETRFTVAGPVNAGSTIEFEKRLLDLFTDTRDLKVEVVAGEGY